MGRAPLTHRSPSFSHPAPPQHSSRRLTRCVAAPAPSSHALCSQSASQYHSTVDARAVLAPTPPPAAATTGAPLTRDAEVFGLPDAEGSGAPGAYFFPTQSMLRSTSSAYVLVDARYDDADDESLRGYGGNAAPPHPAVPDLADSFIRACVMFPGPAEPLQT